VDPGVADADLVAAALRGCRDALAVLLRRHWHTATFLSARVLGSADLAEDAVQEAAVAAMTDLGRLRAPDRFGAWFCGIALNVSRRWLRQLWSEVPAPPADRACESPGPAEAAEAADLAARVRRAIGQLPAGQRDAVLLFYLQGLSHREVAGELGISAGAVKARLHQARAGLAPRLAGIIDEQEATTVTAASSGSTEAAEWVDGYVAEILQTPGEDLLHRKHIVILAERDGDRRLPIWIGPAEAVALALTLEAEQTPRPFTWKLAAGLVEAAGATVAEVRITRLQAPVFYAAVLVRGAGGLREVDARPSDAVNLALVTGAPIRINSELFDVVQPSTHADEMSQASVANSDLVASARARLREALEQDCER